MPSWVVGPVEDEPEVVLLAWSVFEVPVGNDTRRTTRHFVGLTPELKHVRVSSPVRTFDPAGRRGRTRSGRVYELRGRPGADADARYVWASWRAMNHVQREWDVTAEVFFEMEEAAG